MKDYFEISVNINPNAIELATEIFFERFECEGVVQAEEKYKDLELVETTNDIAKGYVLFEENEFSFLEVQKIFAEAKKMEKSDKLLVLQVKIEEEVRQIVSGIAQFYKPEELVGSNVVVVANLKPVKLRGTMSYGMILCACENDSLEVLKTIKKGEFSKVQ